VTDDLIFVCQAPGSSGRNDAPLAGACGRRLASRCGFDPSALLARERVNLIPYFPGRAGKGHKFPLGMARRAADALAPSLARCRVVFVGLGVARAFGHSHPPFAWHGCRGFSAASMPHPSGVNLWYNSDANASRAADFLRPLLGL
jgi:hypothetical protein